MFLLYGRQPRLPLDAMLKVPKNVSKSNRGHLEQILTKVQLTQKQAQDNLARNKVRMKEIHDRKAKGTPVQSGNSVL